MHRFQTATLLVSAALLMVGGCGGPEPGGAAVVTTTAAAAKPSITVTPPTALVDGQVVHVVGAGFTPGNNLSVVQCADKGEATGAGECNVSGMTVVGADDGGRVEADVPVARGPFGTSGVSCTGGTRCLLVVTTLTRSETASTPITFQE